MTYCFIALHTEQHVIMQYVVSHVIISTEVARPSCGRYLSVCFGSSEWF